MAIRDWAGRPPLEWVLGAYRGTPRAVPRDVPRRWHVAAVSPGRGPDVVEALHERDIDAYQPMETVWRRNAISRRRYKAQAPIFGQYLFVGIEEGGSFHKLHEIEGLHGLLSVISGDERRPAEVPFALVDDLRQAQARGEFDATRSKKLEVRPGLAVNIIAGPFSGYVGEVKEARKDGRWLILTKALGGGPMEIDEFKIEVLS